MFKEVKKYFGKHSLYKLVELCSVRPYCIAQLKHSKYMLCLFEENNLLSEVYKKRLSIYKELIKHFNKKSFLIMTFHGTSIKIYDQDLLVDVVLERKQEIQLVDKYDLFKQSLLRNGCGVIILFKNESDYMITNITNCFGVWYD